MSALGWALVIVASLVFLGAGTGIWDWRRDARDRRNRGAA